MSTIRIGLDEKDFRCLVRGGELVIRDGYGEREDVVHIILGDIGFDAMDDAVLAAVSGQDLHVGRERR